ncbi:MAG: hypothetical protein GY811_19810 [Myxococcales bacterium]|nr:hypothetical protein [Myxococcales bacterium]
MEIDRSYCYWHMRKDDADQEMTRTLAGAGWTVIRARDEQLEALRGGPQNRDSALGDFAPGFHAAICCWV